MFWQGPGMSFPIFQGWQSMSVSSITFTQKILRDADIVVPELT